MNKDYTHPELGIVSFETESGFAQSAQFDSTNRTEKFIDDEDYKL